MVDAEAVTITIPICNNGIREIYGTNRTTTFQYINQLFESPVSVQNFYLDLHTEKTLMMTQKVEK